MVVFKIREEELNTIVHDLIKIASILKTLENGSLTPVHRKVIHKCEIRLHEIRRYFLESVEENGDRNG